MKIKRAACEIPVRNHAEVLVVGGGPAGFGAAVAAARAGAKTTLVERDGLLGGMWTLGLVSPFFDVDKKPGLNAQLKAELARRGGWGGLWDIAFDPNEMAFLLDELAVDAGVDILLRSLMTEPIMEGNELKGVVVEDKSGARAITADVVVDATGDGDVAARAGAPFDLGRETDGALQPMTMMFRIGGVRDDYPRDDTHLWYKKLVERIPEEEVLADVPFSHPAIIRLPMRGEALIQWTHVRKHCGLDADRLSDAHIEGRRQVRRAMKFFQAIRDVLGDVQLRALPAVIGVRETRRIKGEYYITEQDVKQGLSAPDAVCRVYFGVDIHEPDQTKQSGWGHPGFDIPLRSLVPLGVENLLTAGRCISGSFVAHAAYRVTGDCLAMGEAAGRTAAAAAKAGRRVRDQALKEPLVRE